MKGNDIGIIGYWFATNYGGVASYYSLYKKIEELGYFPFFVENPYLETDREGIDTFPRKFFSEIGARISDCYKINQLELLNKLADTFVLGSDQVLTSLSIKAFGNLFLMGFAENKRKIAISSSCGGDNLNVDSALIDYVRKNLKDFTAISVREYSAINIMRDKFGIYVDHVVDPIFFTSKDNFYNLAKPLKNEMLDEPYLLAYILDPTPDKKQAITKMANELGLKIIIALDGRKFTHKKNADLMGMPDETLPELDFQEWLYYLSNSSWIFTDSFHGASMALILNKPFIVYANHMRGYPRFLTLAKLFDVKSRLIENSIEITTSLLKEQIDFNLINQKIKVYSKDGENWLIDALKKEVRNKKASVTEKLDKNFCMGCGACVSVCPVEALKLEADEVGYYRATIAYDKCIDCGRCSKICPALTLPQNENTQKPSCYEFIAADENVLYKSSSGGIFTILAEEVFRKNGAVGGAAWKDDFSVEHILIEDKKDLYKLQKSKYLQSYLGNIFKYVKAELDNNRFVLFSGCPCQIIGLKAYLGKEYENLLLVDLLCTGAPSTLFFQKYLTDSFPEGIKQYEFRYKSQSVKWDCTHVNITKTNGSSKVYQGGREDSYQRVFHNHVMCAPHCEKCKYQSVPRFGDLTIGDFWGIGQNDKQIDTSKGVSVILCNNDKGKKFLDSIPREAIGVKKGVPLEWLGGNGCVTKDSHNYASPKRDEFYKAIKEMPFSKAVDYALKPNHGIYRDIYSSSNALLQYSASFSKFQFDSSIWEEHCIDGITVLLVKPGKWQIGRYAVMPLCKALSKDKKYIFNVRFKIKTDSDIINFHVKDAGSNLYQVIHTCNVHGKNDGKEWMELSISFEPRSTIYDEFMIGASQIKGQNNFIAFDYINISEG